MESEEWGLRRKLTEMEAAVMGVSEGVVNEREVLEAEAKRWMKLKWLREKPDGVEVEEVVEEAQRWLRALERVREIGK